MSIQKIIDRIRLRPPAFLGSQALTPLSHFLAGYQAAQNDYNIESEEIIPLSFRFMNEFVSIKLGNDDNRGWCHKILDYCQGHEEKALEKFFVLYDEFSQVKLKRYWKAVLSQENISYNNSMNHGYQLLPNNQRKPIFDNPIAVYIAELTVPAYFFIVEEENQVKLDSSFFKTMKSAAQNKYFPEGAETYFGKIENWQEFYADNLKFDKNLSQNFGLFCRSIL